LNKKYAGVLAIVVVAAAAAFGVWADTWTSCVVSMTAHSASVVTIGQFEDCLCTIPFNVHDWNGVVQGQTYECKYYIRNTGTVGVWITYLPTDLTFDDDQTRFHFDVDIIEFGTPCQLDSITPVVMLEKDPSPGMCLVGYFLGPGKVIKIDVMMRVDALVSGGNWAFDFTIYGCA